MKIEEVIQIIKYFLIKFDDDCVKEIINSVFYSKERFFKNIDLSRHNVSRRDIKLNFFENLWTTFLELNGFINFVQVNTVRKNKESSAPELSFFNLFKKKISKGGLVLILSNT